VSTRILTAVSKRENNTQNIEKSQHVSSAKQQQEIINKPGYTSVSVRVHE